MKKNIKLKINQISELIILFLISFNSFSQEIPVVYYEFNDNDILKATHGPNATSNYLTTSARDRNGILGAAYNFSGSGGKIQLPNLTSYLPDLTNISHSDKLEDDFGYTISFWVQLGIDQVLDSPEESELPYLPDDPVFQTFYILDDRFETDEIICYDTPLGADCEMSNQPGFGLSIIRDRVVINRLIEDTNPVIPWNLWLWDPVSITTADWYHVVMVVKYNNTKTYLFDENGNTFCRLNYFRAPNLAYTSDLSWGIGNPAGLLIEAVKSVDDFKIYGSAHDIELVKSNHNLEKPLSWSSAPEISAKISNDLDYKTLDLDDENLENNFTVYPNPVEDILNIKIFMT